MPFLISSSVIGSIKTSRMHLLARADGLPLETYTGVLFELASDLPDGGALLADLKLLAIEVANLGPPSTERLFSSGVIFT